jgi:hypothetical protein
MTSFSRRRFIQLAAAAGAGTGAALAGPAPQTAAHPQHGTHPRRIGIATAQGTNLATTASPDGQRLIVEIQGILFAVDRDGRPATQLTSWELEAARPDWSRTGAAVTFEACQGGNFHVWTMAPDGSRIRQRTDGPWDDREPAWSPDGRRVAFSSDRAVGDSIETGSTDIWLLDVNSGGLTRLTRDPGADYQPSWSADGQRVLFVRNATGVMSVAVDGGAEPVEEARVAEGVVERPAWSPAGALAYVHIRPPLLLGPPSALGTSTAVVVDGVDVTSDEDVFAVPLRWLNADELLYTADGGIRIRNIAQGSVVDIPFDAALSAKRHRYLPKDFHLTSRATEPVRGITFPRLSRDGQQVAFIAMNAVWLKPLHGTPRKLVEPEPQFLMHSLNWSPDGGSLLFSTGAMPDHGDRHQAPAGGLDLLGLCLAVLGVLVIGLVLVFGARPLRRPDRLPSRWVVPPSRGRECNPPDLLGVSVIRC